MNTSVEFIGATYWNNFEDAVRLYYPLNIFLFLYFAVIVLMMIIRYVPLWKHCLIMKNLICILLFALPGLVVGQTTSYGNFKVVDQEIIYQKIFLQDSISATKLADYYKTLSYLSNVTIAGEEVTFDMNDLTVDYKKFQFAQNATPLIIQTGKYSGKASIGVKDGKYRVTVRSIQLTGNIDYKKISEKENLTTYSCVNSGTAIHQNWCKPNTLGLLDKAFTDKLQFVDKDKKADGDW